MGNSREKPQRWNVPEFRCFVQPPPGFEAVFYRGHRVDDSGSYMNEALLRVPVVMLGIGTDVSLISYHGQPWRRPIVTSETAAIPDDTDVHAFVSTGVNIVTASDAAEFGIDELGDTAIEHIGFCFQGQPLHDYFVVRGRQIADQKYRTLVEVEGKKRQLSPRDDAAE